MDTPERTKTPAVFDNNIVDNPSLPQVFSSVKDF
jgi:hypothetical protein